MRPLAILLLAVLSLGFARAEAAAAAGQGQAATAVKAKLPQAWKSTDPIPADVLAQATKEELDTLFLFLCKENQSRPKAERSDVSTDDPAAPPAHWIHKNILAMMDEYDRRHLHHPKPPGTPD